jgi:hypothetical protein
MLNTIYVISNMHLNFHLGICPSGHSRAQKVSPLCEGVGSIPKISKFLFVSIYIIFSLSLRQQNKIFTTHP